MKTRDRLQWNRRRRWPTVRGENPPQGIPYRSFVFWGRHHAIEVRIWTPFPRRSHREPAA